MANIKSMLDDLIEAEIDELKFLELGSEEMSRAIKDLVEIHKLRMDEMKAKDCVAGDVVKQRKDLEESIYRWVNVGVTVAELLVPVAFYNAWVKMGLEFEKEGTFTSSVFKNLFNRFKPTSIG